jgi:HlyD family secretion protein
MKALEEQLQQNRKAEPPAPRKKKRTSKSLRNTVIALVVVVAALAVWLASGDEEATGNNGSTYQVAREDLVITVVEGGNLKAQKSVNIECEVEGQSTIVFLMAEGSYVKEGDLLVELDSSDLEERFTQQEISYESAKASKIQAEENLKIQKSQNESDIKSAELNLEFAEKDLKRFIEGDWPLKKMQLENSIILANEEKTRADDRVEWTKQLEAKGFVTSDELEADKLTLKRREIDLDEAKETKDLALKYDYDMDFRKLNADRDEAVRELDRTKARAASQIALKEADLRSREAQFRLQEERFNKLKEQLEKCRIHAPQDGLVVYGEQDSGRHRWGGSDSNMIEEGANVRYRQTLITLPDVSVMMVDTKVHESAVDKVRVGMEARVKVDAFPDKEYRGMVTKVGVLADSQSRWLNPDLKVYSTDITLENGSGNLKPGMSAMVEIIVDRLGEVISVPVQSVFRRSEREVCYVAGSGSDIEVRPVVVGLNNDQFVVIEKGLAEGEEVLLHEPAVGMDLDLEELALETDEDSSPASGKTPGQTNETVPRTASSKAAAFAQEEAAPKEHGDREDEERGRPDFSPEMMKQFEKFRNMSPEERAEAIKKMREEGNFPDMGNWGRDRGDRGARERRGEGGN